MYLKRAMRYYRLWIYSCNVLLLAATWIFVGAATWILSDYRLTFLTDSGSLRLSHPIFLFMYVSLIFQGGVLQLIGFYGAVRMSETTLRIYWVLLVALLALDGLCGGLWLAARYTVILAGLRTDLGRVFLHQFPSSQENSHIFSNINTHLHDAHGNELNSSVAFGANGNGSSARNVSSTVPLSSMHYVYETNRLNDYQSYRALWDRLESESLCCGVEGPLDYGPYARFLRPSYPLPARPAPPQPTNSQSPKNGSLREATSSGFTSSNNGAVSLHSQAPQSLETTSSGPTLIHNRNERQSSSDSADLYLHKHGIHFPTSGSRTRHETATYKEERGREEDDEQLFGDLLATLLGAEEEADERELEQQQREEEAYRQVPHRIGKRSSSRAERSVGNDHEMKVKVSPEDERELERDSLMERESWTPSSWRSSPSRSSRNPLNGFFMQTADNNNNNDDDNHNHHLEKIGNNHEASKLGNGRASLQSLLETGREMDESLGARAKIINRKDEKYGKNVKRLTDLIDENKGSLSTISASSSLREKEEHDAISSRFLIENEKKRKTLPVLVTNENEKQTLDAPNVNYSEPLISLPKNNANQKRQHESHERREAARSRRSVPPLHVPDANGEGDRQKEEPASDIPVGNRPRPRLSRNNQNANQEDDKEATRTEVAKDRIIRLPDSCCVTVERVVDDDASGEQVEDDFNKVHGHRDGCYILESEALAWKRESRIEYYTGRNYATPRRTSHRGRQPLPALSLTASLTVDDYGEDDADRSGGLRREKRRTNTRTFVYKRGCQTPFYWWVRKSAENLLVLGFCVMSFVKLVFSCILHYEIEEMIQKIQVIKAMDSEVPLVTIDGGVSVGGVGGPCEPLLADRGVRGPKDTRSETGVSFSTPIGLGIRTGGTGRLNLRAIGKTRSLHQQSSVETTSDFLSSYLPRPRPSICEITERIIAQRVAAAAALTGPYATTPYSLPTRDRAPKIGMVSQSGSLSPTVGIVTTSSEDHGVGPAGSQLPTIGIQPSSLPSSSRSMKEIASGKTPPIHRAGSGSTSLPSARYAHHAGSLSSVSGTARFIEATREALTDSGQITQFPFLRKKHSII